MPIVAELNALLSRGLVADIFRMERAHSLLEEIGASSAQLNDRNNGNFGELFGAFQASLISECVLSTARLYDRPNARYPTRCMRYVLNFLAKHAASLPEIREPLQLDLTLKAAGLEGALACHIPNGARDFASALVNHYMALLDHASTSATIESLKKLRDKSIAHNEHVGSVTGPTWTELRQLVTHAKQFVGILGWAWVSTAYDMSGTFTLTEDATRPSRAFNRLLQRLAT
jgi:hypothetical protein